MTSEPFSCSPFVVAVKALFVAEVSAARSARPDTGQATIEHVANTFSRGAAALNGTPVSRAELMCGLGIACGTVLANYDRQAKQPSDDVDLERIVLNIAGAVVTEYRAAMAQHGADDMLGKIFKEAKRG